MRLQLSLTRHLLPTFLLGQDFLASQEGQAFVSKLSENDAVEARSVRYPDLDLLGLGARDVDEEEPLEKRLGFALGLRAGLKVFGGLFKDD